MMKRLICLMIAVIFLPGAAIAAPAAATDPALTNAFLNAVAENKNPVNATSVTYNPSASSTKVPPLAPEQSDATQQSFIKDNNLFLVPKAVVAAAGPMSSIVAANAEQSALLSRQIDLAQTNVSAGKVKTTANQHASSLPLTNALQLPAAAPSVPKESQRAPIPTNVSTRAAPKQMVVAELSPLVVIPSTATTIQQQAPISLVKGNAENAAQVIIPSPPEKVMTLPKLQVAAAVAPTVAATVKQPATSLPQAVAKHKVVTNNLPKINHPAPETDDNSSVWYQNPTVMLLIAFALIATAILLLVWLFWPVAWTKKTVRAEELDESDELAENDFMASQEALPIRLNLARAYLEMDDFPAAEAILQEVILNGTSQQQQEAKLLLEHVAVTRLT